MQLQIRHSTVYRYSEPVRFGRHRLVVRPREGHDVRVESLELTIAPAAEVVWVRDVFGNSVALVELMAAGAELSIRSEVVLTRHAAFGRRLPSPWTVPFPVVYDALESAVAAAYRATSYPDETPAVREFLADKRILAEGHTGDGDAEAILDRLNVAIYEAVDYNRRPEKGTQSPSETLGKKSGSCRDIATLMMECARMLGMAARFASGYLDCPASTAGTASTHAWVEVYLPPLGWMGFDPTLGERSSHKHIACGLANHPRGVMPVSGTYTRTETSKYLGMEVAVGITRL